MKKQNERLKITLDSCILFDFLSPRRKGHKKAKAIIENQELDLYITASVLKEINFEDQKRGIQKLIDQERLLVLDEPRMGTPLPAAIPIDLSHISARRDLFISKHLKKRPGLRKDKVIRDFLIAEAHVRNKNDCLLTNNIKDFRDNPDLVVVTYEDLQSKLNYKF